MPSHHLFLILCITYLYLLQESNRGNTTDLLSYYYVLYGLVQRVQIHMIVNYLVSFIQKLFLNLILALNALKVFPLIYNPPLTSRFSSN